MKKKKKIFVVEMNLNLNINKINIEDAEYLKFSSYIVGSLMESQYIFKLQILSFLRVIFFNLIK